MKERDQIEKYADDILKTVARMAGVNLIEISKHITESKIILANVLVEARKTNGRIGELEKKVIELEKEDIKMQDTVNSIKTSNDSYHKSSGIWKDRIWNAVFTGSIVLVFWILIATNILQPPM